MSDGSNVRTYNKRLFFCSLCDKRCRGYGHNSEPLKKGECCRDCKPKVEAYRLKHHQTKLAEFGK